MVKRTVVLLGAATLAIAAGAAACGGGSDGGGTSAFDPGTCQGGTLTVLNQGGLDEFDPARLYTSGGGALPTLVYRTLTTRQRVAGEAGTKPVPDLATDLGTPSDNAKTWKFTLKDGLRFDDGTPITSADVKYGIERSFSPDLPGGAPYLHDWLVGGGAYKGPYKGGGELKSIETPDPKTIVFKLRQPHGDFSYLATATQFAPVPKAKDTGTKYKNAPVSSGPYRVDKYEPGRKLILTRNPHWSRTVDNQRLACPDRIEVTSGLDKTVINQRLVSGAGADAKAITTDTTVGPEQLAQLGSDPNLAKRVARGVFGETKYLAFDATKKPFDDPRVRQAFAYAINRQSVVNAVGGSALATPATTFLPEGKAFGQQPYDHFPAGQTGNPGKAKELLAQVGHANGLTVELAFPNSDADGYGPKVAAAVQDALKQAGVTVKQKPLGEEDYRTVIGKPATQPPLTLQSWGADWPAGGPFLIPIFDGRQILRDGGNFNLAQLDDPAVNKEIDAINELTDPAQAAPRWGALDAEIGKKALIVPLYHPKAVALYGKDVKNAYVDQWRGWYDVAAVSVK
ncbi:ABC transporter substrate-binding protein [Actinomadura decatromicini]|uniref:ABC transporter substrate-binding protein n=1 Tax=Actinomadura decatromicini TaxID=2604572 RepID=A0A5D3FWU3_9ACTN|nr:ABC transporter substrate-binding protein [Actinomadura decatromicini]TYK52713.1 ABC transporter substrate-binding protein [Actinomadura decatromicini]